MKTILTAQFEAALCMLNDCIEKCPEEHWDGLIAKYPFWQVAYHTLCFVDCYLTPGGNAAFKPRAEFHPKGMEEYDAEYPSRRFSQAELKAYMAVCREKLGSVMQAETRETLEGPSEFPWLPMTRAELHLYNIRHVQHHTGQLGAFLRKNGVDMGRWVKRGWR